MVRHDQRQEHPHEPQQDQEEASHFFLYMCVFKGSCLLEICFYLSYHGSAMVCHDK